MKATYLELELHSLIMAGDDLALAKLYDHHGESIFTALCRWYPKIAQKDKAFLLEAVNEAFWGYYKNPQTFDPDKNTLQRFLEIAAERDLINLLQREKRYFEKSNLPEDVELEEKFWNSIKRDTQATDGRIIEREIMHLIDKELSTHFLNETDITLAKMVFQGIRETDAFVEVLQIQGLKKEEQRREVKRHKDRIIKVIERNQIKSKLKSLLQ